MRTIAMTILALATAVATPAHALQPSDTMTAWKHASPQERADVIERLLGKRGAESLGLIKCLDETSQIPGHADLDIRQVAKFCSKDAAGQPV